MAKILGLDLGTNSIGWAVVDDENHKIKGTGVRIFPEGVEPTTIGKGDGEKSKNASRRESRQQRRNYYRDKLRRIKLLELLIKFDLCPLSTEELSNWKHYNKKEGQSGKVFPNSENFKNWLKLNPYQLRSKAINEYISLHEFGRILYHLIQRRGFLSSRKESDEGGAIYKGKENMTGIDETVEQIKDKTLGSFLYTILPEEGKPYRKIVDADGNELRVRARYTLRDMYIEEFEAIWKKQAGHLKLNNILVPVIKTRFIDGSLFSKRNKEKIERLQKRYGKENIKIEGSKIILTTNQSFKEYLAGNIWYDEDGKIKHKSTDSILFYQRPLRSQKGLLSKCSLEGKRFFDKKNNKWVTTGPTPCPLSHPEFEEYRALQFINNIEYGTRQKLDENQRSLILDLFNKNKTSFDFEKIIKELKLTYEKFNFEETHKVAGNPTISQLKPLFKPEIWDKNKNEIWHCFYFYEDNDKLVEKLSNDFSLEEKNHPKIKNIKLKDGYSSVSLKAIRNIMPFLKKGYKYSDAVILGGVKNAFVKDGYDRWPNFADSHHEIESEIISINRKKDNKEGDAIRQIKLYLIENCSFEENDKAFRKLYHHSQEIQKKETKEKLDEIENLRNPIVQQGINELRRLVNTLIEQYGKFDRIKVELGRDLKNSKQNRQKATRRNFENNRKNEEARQKLSEYGLAHSRENVQRYLLFKEIEEKAQKVCCPYTNKSISISSLLGDENRFQIEHIFPRSTSLDDSFANKTLCDAKFNGLKGNLSPYEFYQKNSDPNLWGGAKSWEAVELRAFNLLPYNKAKRFTAKKIDKKSFIERQLNDTRYISKKAKEILTQVCEDVRVMPGSLTSELRHLWGLNNILQPVEVIEFNNAKIDENKSVNHWIVFDENENPISFHPTSNDKPAISENQTTITGFVSKNKFKSKYYNKSWDVEDLADGEYWKILELSKEPLQMTKMFIEKPVASENELVLRGKVERKKFVNDSLGAKVQANETDGTYWARFKINSVKFELPEPKKQPKKTSKQILLYGKVDNCRFESFIFSCKADVGDGSYWAIIDLDTETPEFIPSMNNRPEANNGQIIIQGSIDENRVFSSEIDNDHCFETNIEKGKYWVVFDVVNEPEALYPLYNEEPILEKDQKLVEGNVWVDKYTGEIKFDPKKNRDDHRHHAIDAIAIALTEQGYFQKLSTYNANKDEKMRGNKYEKPVFEMPWENFFKDAQNAASAILISQKQNNRVLTKINKTIEKNGKKYLSKGYAVSGQLHKEFVFGKRQAPNSEEGFHIRKSVESLTTDKHIDKIVDKRIREIVRADKKKEKELKEQLKKLDTILKKTKTEQEEQVIQEQIDEIKSQIAQLYTLPNKNGERVPIKKVRIKENLGNAEKLKDKLIKKEKSGEQVELNQYVNPRNNHHVAIYKDENGELKERIVTLWEAVERKKQKLPAIDKNPTDGSTFVTSLQINDMFIIGLDENEINWEHIDKTEISPFLYRVQKLTAGVYTFTHHLISNMDVDKYKFNPSIEPYPKVLRKSKGSLNGIKVKIDILGTISKF